MIKEALTILLAIIPGILICWYVYHMDKYEQESRVQLIITFILGMLITIPVMKIEEWGSKMGWDNTEHLVAALITSYIVVALTEELIKYIVLIGYPYFRPFFNEPMDGIVYAVMISMGFATLENMLYASRFGIETTLLRAFTAVPAHASFAIMMGYFVGLSKFAEARNKKIRLLALGILIPWAVHGLYDFFILQEAYESLMILALVVLAVSIFFARKLVIEQQKNSPFKE